jgi:hypothetical protein
MLLVFIISFTSANTLHAQTTEVYIENNIVLQLVWELDIPQGIVDYVFIDSNGYNIFSSQCEDPEKALKEKRMLTVTAEAVCLCHGDDFKTIKETKRYPYSKVAISKNGKNFAIIDHVISGDVESMQWYRNVEKSILRLFNSNHDELAQRTLGPMPHADIFAVGNDQTIVITDEGEDGYSTNMTVFIKHDSTLIVSFSSMAGRHPTFLFDYAEDGSRIFLVYNDKPVDGVRNLGERIVLDDQGGEITRYTYQHQAWWGRVSPKGNYLVEVMAGKYLTIRNKNGKLIADHQIQRIGNYHCAFSPDEKYLSVTPGSWRIYLFRTKNGEMLWNYRDADDNSKFASLAVHTPTRLVFVGRSNPSESSESRSESNTKVMENVSQGKTLCAIKDGKFVNSIGPFPDKGFRSRLQTPEVSISQDQNFLWVKTPTKSYIYRISIKND